MQRFLLPRLLLLLLALFLVTACGGREEPTPAAAAAPTTAPAATPTPVLDTPVPPPAAIETGPRTFQLVSDSSLAQYEVEEDFLSGAVERLSKTLGLFHAVGKTRAIAGQFEVMPGNPPQVLSGQVEVNLPLLTSDDRRRDQRIREEWLESLTYPTATFVITDLKEFPASFVEGQETAFQLVGDMTIRVVTKPMTFAVTATLQGNTLTGRAQGSLQMQDFGIEPPEIPGILKVKDGVVVTVEFVAVEVTAP